MWVFRQGFRNPSRVAERRKRHEKPHLRRKGAFLAKYPTVRRILCNFGFLRRRRAGRPAGWIQRIRLRDFRKILAESRKIVNAQISHIASLDSMIVNPLSIPYLEILRLLPEFDRNKPCARKSTNQTDARYPLVLTKLVLNPVAPTLIPPGVP